MSAVLILGATSDIARALSRAYGKAGRSVILAARHSERLAPDVADLKLRFGIEARAVEFDTLDIARHGTFLDGLGELPGTVIAVVGLMGSQARSEVDPEAAALVMRTNYEGPATILGEAANRMARRGSGTLVGISSLAGQRGRASNYVYGSAKAGLTAFLSGLRNRLSGTGVHVVTVLPGYVATRLTEGLKAPRFLISAPEEIAAAILAAETKRRDIIYGRPIWRLVNAVICAMPERIFKKTRI